jgi:D-alanyl-D-alanine carboxypeptidase/D-alanyl-D-alanine-endopeptidase (penicillin-binding protein 4)
MGLKVLFLSVSIFATLSSFLCQSQPIIELDKALNDLAKSEYLRNGQISFTLLDTNGDPISTYNPDQFLSPASNLKLLPSIAALDILGDDYRFKTLLGYSGKIVHGVLEGDIVIQGFGDPTLGSNRFSYNQDFNALLNLWVSKIKSSGIKSVRGNIIANAGKFSFNTIPDGWIWTDIGNYYGAGSGGININENQYRLFFKPGKVGDQADVLRTEPEIPYLKFVNEMKTGKPGSGDLGYIFGGPFSEIKVLQGTIPAGLTEFSIKGSIPDPAYFLAFSLHKKLLEHQILISEDILNAQLEPKYLETKVVELHTQLSPPLSEIVKELNYHSINLYAEALLNILGYNKYGLGNTKKGLQVLQEWLLVKYRIELPKNCLQDGSGLSPTNSISSDILAKLLFQNKDRTTFVQALPVSGMSGTMKNFCASKETTGKILAKSGSYNRVIGYSGYIVNQHGKLQAFSILINNYNGSYSAIRKQIEIILTKASKTD